MVQQKCLLQYEHMMWMSVFRIGESLYIFSPAKRRVGGRICWHYHYSCDISLQFLSCNLANDKDNEKQGKYFAIYTSNTI